MNAKITNITREGSRIRCFITFDDGMVETNLFPPEASILDMESWRDERINFFNSLEQKVEELRNEIIEE